MSQELLPPVKRDPKGRVLPGSRGPNPGGMTVEVRQARDLVRKALANPELVEIWLVAYRQKLMEGDVTILKDFADRVAGKPKEHVELTVDADSAVNLLGGLTVEELKAVARAQVEKELNTLKEK